MTLESNEAIGEKIAVFDICDTLFYSNTTHDFIGFLAEQRFSTLKKTFYQVVNNRKSPARYFFLALSKFSDIDFHKKLNVGLLKGFGRNELESAAQEFVLEYLSERKILQTNSLVEKFRSQNVALVLCSSSIEPVVKAVAEFLKIKNFVCTKLDYKNNICTGKIFEEISDRKVSALQNYGIEPPFFCAVSDNLSDAPLLTASNEKIAIIHNNKGYIFWKNYPVAIIDLRK